MTTVHICESARELCEELAHSLLHHLREAADEGRDLVVAVSGGSTPRPLYEHLASLGPAAAPWHHLQVVFADERDVAEDDPDSTLGMVRQLWLDPVGVPREQIHAPPVPAGDLEAAAREYQDTLRELAGEPARLDWVLLGLGEDGHTASLFPRHPALEVEDRDVLAVFDSPKPPPRRVTLSFAALRRAAEVHLLVTGGGKAAAVHEALEAETNRHKHPTHALREMDGGTVTWWLDWAAEGRDQPAQASRESSER